MPEYRSEKGQALPIAAFLVCAMVAVALVVTHTARTANVQARAQTAADAAALAGAVDGMEGASFAASENGGRLVDFEVSDTGTTVKVQIEDRVAGAKAKLTGGIGEVLAPAGEGSSSG